MLQPRAPWMIRPDAGIGLKGRQTLGRLHRPSNAADQAFGEGVVARGLSRFSCQPKMGPSPWAIIEPIRPPDRRHGPKHVGRIALVGIIVAQVKLGLGQFFRQGRPLTGHQARGIAHCR